MFLLGCQNDRHAAQSSPIAHNDPTESANPIEVTSTAIAATETPNPLQVALTAVAATQSAATEAPPTPRATVEIAISPAVEAYLNEAIDIIRENALLADQVDWEKMETAVAWLLEHPACTP